MQFSAVWDQKCEVQQIICYSISVEDERRESLDGAVNVCELLTCET